MYCTVLWYSTVHFNGLRGSPHPEKIRSTCVVDLPSYGSQVMVITTTFALVEQFLFLFRVATEPFSVKRCKHYANELWGIVWYNSLGTFTLQ